MDSADEAVAVRDGVSAGVEEAPRVRVRLPQKKLRRRAAAGCTNDTRRRHIIVTVLIHVLGNLLQHHPKTVHNETDSL